MENQDRRQPEFQVPVKVKNRGPRSLWIDRWKNGFGFTLRHFVVYPPESYMVMAKEKRLGLRQGSANLNEPMDTIFVKAVHEGTSAHAAGLETGDRIVSVNGETIAGKTYAQVVQQIHSTPDRLNLLVVPKEEDIIQQYYIETAHNPKTNARPRLRSPEIQDPKRASALSLPGTHRTVGNQRMISPIRQQQEQMSPAFGSWHHEMRAAEGDPLLNQMAWTNQSSIGSENRGTMEMHRLIGQQQGSRRLTNPVGNGLQADQMSVIKAMHGTFLPAGTIGGAGAVGVTGCRLSLDGGALDRRESSSSSTLTDDSIIMSRIRKSCEQKEEFLRNTSTPLYSQIIAREFYARPQKFQKPVWPPNCSDGEEPEGKVSPLAVSASAPSVDRPSERMGKSSGKLPSRVIGTSSPQSFESGEPQQSWEDSPLSRSQSEEFDSNRMGMSQPKLHLVSRRAMQFETGQFEEEDKTPFYRSELSRLSGKRTVPNVALIKQEFELVGRESSSTGSPSGSREGPFSLDSYSSPKDVSGLSGNRTVIVGSKQIHVEPPSDFKQLGPEVEESVPNKQRGRSNSAEGWPGKEANHGASRSSFGGSMDRAKGEERQRHKAVRQDSYLAAVKPVTGNSVPALPSSSTSARTVQTTSDTVVVRREKNASSGEDDRSTRRISYLKATSNDQMNLSMDSKESAANSSKNSTTREPESMPRKHPIDVQKSSDSKENYKTVKEGWLNCKVAVIDGKRAGDRSWKQIWVVLTGPYLSMQKDKQNEQPDSLVDLRSCSVDIPQNYTKKKNVFRIRTDSDTEYWLQAEDQDKLEEWTRILDDQSQAVPSTLSPQAVQKGIKKLGNLRTRSPTGQSPASKTRKSAILAEQPVSPKSKTWKGKLGKQFRKMQGSGSPSSPTISYPEGATIKVPIEMCPPSTLSEFIPMIVEKCTSIVEARGLEVVGIYRVPGNTAAVTALTEAVNRGMDCVGSDDPRWNDVNVISSLLKSFFRNLPDSLFTSELYPKFIEADKIIDPKLRMITIRKLVKELPEHNFETLKHLLYHLKKIVSKSAINKMETQNLAIVFGPTLLTTTDLMSLVTDTSHQCRIVESLISHVDWFFSNDDVNSLENLSVPMTADAQDSESALNANLLLGNIHKIEGYPRLDHSLNKDMSPKDIVSSIISAANRKISKGKSKKMEKVSSVTQCETETTRSTVKKMGGKEETEPSTSMAASIVSSFVGEMVRNSREDINKSPPPSLNFYNEVIRAYSGLDPSTVERIKRFEQETHAMLHRDPTRIRRETEIPTMTDKQTIEMKLKLAKRELESEDNSSSSPSDLTRKSNAGQFSSHGEDSNSIRKGGSFESIHETTPNGSLKRFKSNKEEGGNGGPGNLRPASSLDSLHERTKSDLSDDGNDFVVSLARTFDRTLKSVLSVSDSSSIEEENKSMSEKAEYENVIEQESKLCNQGGAERKSASGEEETSSEEKENGEEKEEEEDESKKCKLKLDAKSNEKWRKPEGAEPQVLRAKNSENSANLKRSESLSRSEKPEGGGHVLGVKRSDSMNRCEKENEFAAKSKHSDSLKTELKRSDSLTKYEKTETNLMNKRKQQQQQQESCGVKRSSSKEKENIFFVKLKRKNGMPDRSIKRRHTVGGTKDFDKMPWLDNRLQSEAMENEKSLKGKEKRHLRTSSPDLSSSRLKATIEAEGLSIEVSLLGSRGNVLATLRKPLVPTSPTGRPQSMPPVSQIFKVPLESHV